MSYHPCVSGCGCFLAPQDGHDRCLTCLGIQHAKEAFVDGSCSSCGDMTISELRNRRNVKHGGVPLPLPRSSVHPGTQGSAVSGGVKGDLRVTVRASPRGVLHPSSAPQPVGLPLERAGTSAERGTPPYWPNRTWLPELMLLATAPPWPIPLRKDLLSQRRRTFWHPRPDLWKLHVWSLDGTRRF